MVLEFLDARVRGEDRLPLRDQVVPRVARTHTNQITGFTEIRYRLLQNELYLGHGISGRYR